MIRIVLDGAPPRDCDDSTHVVIRVDQDLTEEGFTFVARKGVALFSYTTSIARLCVCITAILRGQPHTLAVFDKTNGVSLIVKENT